MNAKRKYTKLLVSVVSIIILISTLGTVPLSLVDNTKELQQDYEVEETKTNDGSNLLEPRGTRASDRTVLAELFTNWDCSFCPPANAAIEELLDVYDPSQLVMVSYHVNWPGPDDPFYLFNPPDVDNRKNYYGVGGVPYMLFNGVYTATDTYSNYKSIIDSGLATTSPLEITLDGNLDIGAGTGSVDVTIEVTDTLPAGTKVIRFAVVEDNKYADGVYVDRHRYVMRDMLAEESLTVTTIGQTQYVSRSFPIDPIYNINSTSIVVFVQNDNGKGILQAAMYDYIPQTILVVDDDQSTNPSGYEDDYHLVLCYMDYAFDGWVLNEKGHPTGMDLANYEAVIWITSDTTSLTLEPFDQTAITDYLDGGGGSLFLCGENVGSDIGMTSFYQDYLHANFVTPDTNQNQITGVNGDPISGPFFGTTLPISDNSPSEITPTSDAYTVFNYSSSAQSGAIRAEHDSNSRVVYFAFLYFEDFPGTDSLADKALVMEYVLNWLVISSQPNEIPLSYGWNLISLPYIPSDPQLSVVLDSIQGEYDSVQWFDIMDTTNHWKNYHDSKPAILNDLVDLTPQMGIWVHITNPNGTIFVCPGFPPPDPQPIEITFGWNLVGYPSLSNKDVAISLIPIRYGDEVDSIWTYDAESQMWRELGPHDTFEVGKGYWIHSLVETLWEVPL